MVVSSSGIQDAASWLRKCFDCWCSFVCISGFLVFLLDLCGHKSCSLLFFVVCPFLCFVYTSLLSLSLSLSVFFLLVRRELSTYRVDPPSFSHKGGAEKPLTCMIVTRSEKDSPQIKSLSPTNHALVEMVAGCPHPLPLPWTNQERPSFFSSHTRSYSTYLLCWIGLPTLLHTHSHSSLYSLSNRKSLLLPLITHTYSLSRSTWTTRRS